MSQKHNTPITEDVIDESSAAGFIQAWLENVIVSAMIDHEVDDRRAVPIEA